MTTQSFFIIAAGFYLLSLAAAFLPERKSPVLWGFLLPAILANAAAVGIRYWTAWPMLPMYLGPQALPLGLALFLGFIRGDGNARWVRRLILSFALLLCILAILFPKDFYLPFLKSYAPLAHAFFVFGVIGKACFIVSAVWAVIALFFHTTPQKSGNAPAGSFSTHHRWLRWAVWGFVFWTLSMFAGELWTYLGWGTPVVWDDPAITTTMATWFFYICLLHLHLTGSWSARGRAVYAASGALVVVVLNFVPELGPFRWLF
jgi:hypothetical protein